MGTGIGRGLLNTWMAPAMYVQGLVLSLAGDFFLKSPFTIGG
jgi:hypothetical protein